MSADPSSNVRTFAKDFAALAAKDPEAAQKSKSWKPQKPPKTPKPLKPKVVPEPVVIPVSPEKEQVSLENQIDTSTTGAQKEGVAMTETPAPALVALPKIETGDIVASIPEEPTDEERAVILARLRSRIQPLATPAVITAIESAPMAIVAPPIPAAVVTAPILPPEVVPAHVEDPSPIHTYTSDFADRIDQQHASTFSVLAAENDAPRQSAPRQKHDNTRILAIIAGIIFIAVGAGAVVAAYLYVSRSAPIVGITAPPSLISPDSSVKLTGNGSSLMSTLAQAGSGLHANNILLTYVDESTTTAQGVTEEQATGGAFITELNLQAPDILLRNIDPSSMVGVVSAGTQTAPFFILRVTSYQGTFAGMLQWEPTMLQNLEPLYPLYPEPVVQPMIIASTTQTSTTTSKTSSKKVVTKAQAPSAPVVVPQLVDPAASTGQFVDEIVANHSARALKDNSGRTIVLYGYADQETLIIARDEAAFTLLLARLAPNGS